MADALWILVALLVFAAVALWMIRDLRKGGPND